MEHKLCSHPNPPNLKIDREIIMDYLGEPNVITRFLRRGNQECQRNIRIYDYGGSGQTERRRFEDADFEDEGRAKNQKTPKSSGSWKRQGSGFSP